MIGEPMSEPPREPGYNVNTVLEPGLCRRLDELAGKDRQRTTLEMHTAYDGPHFPWLCGNYFGDLAAKS